MMLGDNISKKPKLLLAGVVLMILLAIFGSFLSRKLTPSLEKVYTKSTSVDIDSNY